MWVGGRSGRCARRDPLRNVERPGTGAFEFIALTCTASAIAAPYALTKLNSTGRMAVTAVRHLI